MINFETFFKNHFDTEEVIDMRLKIYTESHLQRMTSNNPGGIYTTRITATANAYTGYFGAISDETVKFALQQGLTITMNNAVKDFKKSVQQKEGIIKGTWGKTSQQYQEFFPQGLSEYDNATPGNVNVLMNLMVEASTAHVADLGAPFVTLFTDLRTTFTDARTAQLAVIGQVSGLRTSTETTRNDMEVELMTNLLFIAMNNIGHPERVTDYFDQAALVSHAHHTGGGSITFPFEITGSLNGNVATTYNLNNIDTAANPTLSFLLESMGPSTIRYYATDSPTGLPGAGAVIDVVFGTGVNKTFAELVAELGLSTTKHYLGIMNIGASPTGYKVTVSV